MPATVQILLATYNGERFLRKQLDSLLQQTFQDFTVLIRDDGSTDQTLTIITEYRQNFSDKIILLQDNLRNVGAAKNFGLLLEKSSADYIFFCDQDDIWLPDKMKKSLAAIQTLETANIPVPCLVYSDMKSMDEQGTIIADSVWKQLKLDPDYFTLNRLLVQNIPHGCTMVINKAMRNLACPFPEEVILHDHWIALLAASCGKYSAIKEPTVLLRNHTENLTRRKFTLTDKLKRFSSNFLSRDEYEFFIKIRVSQARVLRQRIADCATQEQLDLLSKFILLEKTRGTERMSLFLRQKFFRTTFWHTLKMIARA